MRKIEKLEAETLAKQTNLEQLRREKVELENTLEQEQEALVNKLWKRMDKLETEKRMLQIKLDQPVSDPASPRDINNGDTAANLSGHIQTLRQEVARLRHGLASSQQEHSQSMQRIASEERHIREENLRLQRKLQLEVERREALCRQLSESESSLEMEEERHYNEQVFGGGVRQRTLSSPHPSPSVSRPLSPGISLMQQSAIRNPILGGDQLQTPSPRCQLCGQQLPSTGTSIQCNTPASAIRQRTSERFIKPAVPIGKRTTLLHSRIISILLKRWDIISGI